MSYIATKTTKSKGIAILLVALFGPLGMFYSTIIGGVIMTLIAPVALFILFVKGALDHSETTIVIAIGWAMLAYILCFVWSVAAVDDYNHKIISESSSFNIQPYQSETKESIYENLERIKRLFDEGVLNETQFQKQKEEYMQRLHEIEEGHFTANYYEEFERAFSKKDYSEVIKNWIIAILLIGLLISLYIVIK